MSVLSEQCEALRLWAKQLREGEPILASDLREAADTILNLRDMHAKLDEVTALYVGEAIDSDERDSDEARIFAEYAAKLMLKEDA